MNRKYSHFAVAVAGTTAAGLLIAAHHSTGAGDNGHKPDAGPGLRISRPLDAYAPSDADVAVITKARRTFEIRCMNRLGFPGRSFAGLTAASTDDETRSQHLPFLDVQHARHNGYHGATDRARPSDIPGGPTRPPQFPTSTSALDAMYGRSSHVNGRAVPQGGCVAQGERDLEKGASAELPVDPRALSDEAQSKADRDPAVAAALSAWRSCMTQHGYHYATPQDAVDDAAGPVAMDGRFHTDPSAHEIATAVSDAQCRTRTSLYDTWSNAVTRYQTEIVAHDRAQLKRAKTITQVWLQNARAALHSEIHNRPH